MLTNLVLQKLQALPEGHFLIHQQIVDRAEAARLLAGYLAKVIHFALNEIKGEDALEKQIAFCNAITQFVQTELRLDMREDLLAAEGRILRAVISKIGKTDEQLRAELTRKLPKSGLSVSNLFTGSNADISIDSELEKDIASADRLYWLVSFIRWSGVRIFAEALREFTAREGTTFKVITTSYMGATEVKALEFLLSLPRTEVKVSYQTQIERLHAKAYLFERNSGFDTAYIGSSNLSNAALTRGLEWNIRVTTQENPHIIGKARATFEHYWHNPEFEALHTKDLSRFADAITKERGRESNAISTEYFRLDLLPFQKEILDKLTTERTVHQRRRNLIVAATGTGKTVIAAFDYKRFCENRQVAGNLLFIAHRKEILTQALVTFRAVLGPDFRDFGNLWVGPHTPAGKNLDHLFLSVQSFNANQSFFRERFHEHFFDFIVIDEAHHSQADSYRPLFELFRPQILLGLTATPERMDGRSLLPDFDDKIAAEIRLPDALNLKLLTPFQYFCISDDSVDLRKVKWTAGKYDTDQLTAALSNKRRVALVIEAIHQYLANPFTAKALCFCTSRQHAEFMSKELGIAGLKATHLISGSTDEERSSIRQRLMAGEVNFVCVVDIFNEGVDIPEIDTVIFLRPTESLTVFLQQLGRGLRLSVGKECLTVLDFVSQAHASYNFTEKFRALVGKTSNRVQQEIEENFPHLPLGCSVKMERHAREYILENIRSAVFNARRIRKELAIFSSNTHQELTLSNFLQYHQLDIRAVYAKNNWASLKKEAGVVTFAEDGHYRQLAKGIRRLTQINSLSYLVFIQRLLLDGFKITDPDALTEKFALMFYYDLWQKGVGAFGFASIYEGIEKVASYPVLQEEVAELVAFLMADLGHTTREVELGYPNVLQLHARYSRDQILSAFGKSTPETPFPSQEGVISLPDHHTELLLVTLNKSDKDFSPATQYEDYAISEKIFHWQSQNRTGPDSPIGISYIKHREQGKLLLLFVREEKKDGYGFTCPYHFLGPVSYISHKGAKPMSINWELAEPMPAYLWKAAAKMAVG